MTFGVTFPVLGVDPGADAAACLLLPSGLALGFLVAGDLAVTGPAARRPGVALAMRRACEHGAPFVAVAWPVLRGVHRVPGGWAVRDKLSPTAFTGHVVNAARWIQEAEARGLETLRVPDAEWQRRLGVGASKTMRLAYARDVLSREPQSIDEATAACVAVYAANVTGLRGASSRRDGR